MKIHAARWCDGGVTHRSRRGSLADRAVQTAKRRAAEALLSQVYVSNTCQDYRVTATAPEYDLLLAIRQRRLRYLGHILRMPESRVVRRALVALVKGGTVYPKGSLFMDCQTMEMHQLVALAQLPHEDNVLNKFRIWKERHIQMRENRSSHLVG